MRWRESIWERQSQRLSKSGRNGDGSGRERLWRWGIRWEVVSLGAWERMSLSKSDLGGRGRESLMKGLSPGPNERERGNPGEIPG